MYYFIWLFSLELKFKKSQCEAENKKDNPKEILYQFLNLIENQERKLFLLLHLLFEKLE